MFVYLLNIYIYLNIHFIICTKDIQYTSVVVKQHVSQSIYNASNTAMYCRGWWSNMCVYIYIDR